MNKHHTHMLPLTVDCGPNVPVVRISNRDLYLSRLPFSFPLKSIVVLMKASYTITAEDPFHNCHSMFYNDWGKTSNTKKKPHKH